MNSGKKILVTGASGFVGSFLVEYGLSLGYEVTAAVRSTSSRKYLSDKRIRVVEIDMSDKSSMVRLFTRLGRFQYVVHNAGITKSLDASAFERVNVRYTQNLVEALRESQSIPDKFLFMSSLAACGPGDPHSLSPLTSDHTPRPDTHYGRSKLQAERFLQSRPELPFIIFRPTGIYGPREKDYFQYFKSIRMGLDIRAGFKPQKLSFIYVRDLVRLVYSALESSITGRTFMVSDGKVYDSREFGQIVARHLGRKPLVLPVPLCLLWLVSVVLNIAGRWFGETPTLNRDKFRILSARNWACDNTDMIQAFGFRPEYDLDRGVAESIQWYREEHWL